jgi:hypothetical protein
MRFTYRSGQRVLDGFTLKRGVGKGGFGEVYFALSDAGKEVALKLLAEREVEMRGVLNCLNLKHPNLVHVYDVREDEHGDTWIVMEYVLGESLAQVIQRHRHGLPENLAREWFGALSRAVGYLHDQGVVHRDLKPANIFIENGGLKVGDYGLCKTMTSGVRQTQRVGTVHYMAPEIGSGRYDKSIDIYACGVMLYEMLTGRLPFDGETDNEIVMKHLTAAPDLSALSPGFAPVLAKALDKNPLKRYGSMAEFARAVEATTLPLATPVPPPLPGFAPGMMVAGASVTTSFGGALPPSVAAPHADQTPIILPDAPVAKPLTAPIIAPGPPLPLPTARPVAFAWRDRLSELAGSLGVAPLVIALALVPYGLVRQVNDPAALGRLLLVSSALAWVMTLGSAGRSYRSADTWWPRLRFAGLGLAVGLLAFWLDGWGVPAVTTAAPATSRGVTLFGVATVEGDAVAVGAKYLLYFAGALGAGRWWRLTARDRKDRLSVGGVLAAGFWGGLLVFLWPTELEGVVEGGVLPLALAGLAVQAVSPWVPAVPAPSKKLRLATA